MTAVPPSEARRAGEPAPLGARPYHFPRPEANTLENGLRVLVSRRPQLPLVSAVLGIQAGAAEDPTGLEGLAVMTARLLTEGAGGRTATEVAEETDQLGVGLDHSAGWDHSAVRMRMLSRNLDPAMGLAADIALRPHFEAAEWARERDLRLAEILHDRDDPRALLVEHSSRFVYGTHRYGTSSSGVEDSIRALDETRLGARHAEAFRPSAAFLVLVGDVTPEQGVELARRHFGGWDGAAPSRGPVPEPAPLPPTRILLVDKPGSSQSEVRLMQPSAPRTTPDYFPLLVLNAVFGEAFGSRLFFNLREKNGFTYGVSSHFAMRRGRGPFIAQAAVDTDVTARAVEEFLRELRGIREIPPTPKELQDARGYLSGGLAVDLQSNGSVAERVAEMEMHALPVDYVERFRDRIYEVTPDDVIAAANRNLDPEHIAIVIVGDAARVRASLEKLYPVEVWDVRGTPLP